MSAGPDLVVEDGGVKRGVAVLVRHVGRKPELELQT